MSTQGTSPRASLRAPPETYPEGSLDDEEARLDLDPYSGPRSSNVARAFAAATRREARRERRARIVMLFALAVLGGALAWSATHGCREAASTSLVSPNR